MEGDTVSVKIITDSASDLPVELIATYDIEVVPLLVYLGEKEYVDGETIKPKELYANMRAKQVYKTAQAPIAKFVEVFKKYAAEKRDCIYVGFSSGLSGTFTSATLAKEEVLREYPDFTVDLYDTKCASMGFGLVVLKAAQLAKAGKGQGEIGEAVKFYAGHMEHIFTVDNLEYLFRGGRVSRTAAVVGELLNVKPILNVEDGKLAPLEKVRGSKKLFPRMVQIIKERGLSLAEQTIGISHGDDLAAVEELKEIIRKELGCEKFIVSMVGCTIGSHSGPGTLAVFFLNDKDPYKKETDI